MKTNEEIIALFLRMEREMSSEQNIALMKIWPFLRMDIFRTIQSMERGIPYTTCYKRHPMMVENDEEVENIYLNNIKKCDILIVDIDSQYVHDKETDSFESRVSTGVECLHEYRIEKVTICYHNRYIKTRIPLLRPTKEIFPDNSLINMISDKICVYFNDKIGKDIMDCLGYLLSYVEGWKQKENYFCRILKAASPRILMLTSGYEISEMVFVRAAKALGIRTVELQHGVINSRHMGYRMPEGIEMEYASELLFAYYPIEDGFIHNRYKPNQIYPVGSYQLEKNLKCRGRLVQNNKVLLVLTINDTFLLRFAEKLWRKCGGYLEIVCRLHPEENRNSLSLKRLMEVADKSLVFEFPENKNIYDSIMDAEWIVGTNTTVLYEASAFDKKCIEIKEPQEKLTGDFTSVTNVDELISLIKQGDNAKIRRDKFYIFNSEQNLRYAISDILND